MIPFDGAFASRSPQDFIDDVLVETARRRARERRGELPLRPPREGRRRAAARAGRVRDARRRARRASTARSSPRPTSATLIEAGEMERAAACLGSPFQLRGAGRPRRQARPHARLPDGEPRARPGARLSRPRRLRVPRGGRARRATGAGGRRRPTSACGPTFVTGRGLLVEAFLLGFDGDLYGRELRLAFLDAPARRAALRVRRRAGRADAARRRGHAPDRGVSGGTCRRPATLPRRT